MVMPMGGLGVAGVGDPRLVKSRSHLKARFTEHSSGSRLGEADRSLTEGIATPKNQPSEPGEGFVSLLGQVHKGLGAGSPLH